MVINKYIFKKINIYLKDILGIFSGQPLVLFILFTKLVDLPFFIFYGEKEKDKVIFPDTIGYF